MEIQKLRFFFTHSLYILLNSVTRFVENLIKVHIFREKNSILLFSRISGKNYFPDIRPNQYPVQPYLFVPSVHFLSNFREGQRTPPPLVPLNIYGFKCRTRGKGNQAPLVHSFTFSTSTLKVFKRTDK